MVALGVEFLDQQLPVARRALPVDMARIGAGHIFAQGLELRALAALSLRLDAIDRVMGEELQRRVLHAAHIGQDVDDGVQRHAPHETRQAERPAPAHPERIDMDLAAPQRPQGERRPRRAAGAERNGLALARLQRAAALEHEIEPHPTHRRAAGEIEAKRDAFADRGVRRNLRRYRDRPQRCAEQRVDAKRGEDEQAIGDRQRPQARLRDHQHQRKRRAGGEDQDRARGRVHQRGAAVWSRMSRITRSALTPSISAPGDSARRWRSSGTASVLMSSGMTKSRPWIAA